MQLTPRLALMLTLPPLLWAGNAVAGRMLVPLVPPLLLNGLRWSGALLLLSGWLLARRLLGRWPALLALALILSAWLTREGIKAEAEYNARTLARFTADALEHGAAAAAAAGACRPRHGRAPRGHPGTLGLFQRAGPAGRGRLQRAAVPGAHHLHTDQRDADRLQHAAVDAHRGGSVLP